MAPFFSAASRQLKGLWPPWVLNVLILVVIWLILLRILIRRASRPMSEPSFKRQELIADEASLYERRKTFPFYLIDPLRKRAPMKDGRNPVFAKDMRAELFGKGSTMVRLFYVSLIAYVLIALLWFILQPYYGKVEFMLVCIGASILLVTPGVAATSLARESEQGNLAALRVTLLRPSRIVMGKARATLACTAPMLVAAILATLTLYPLVCDYNRTWLLHTRVALAAFLFCFLGGNACGILAGAWTRRTPTAMTLAYVLVCVVGVACLLAIAGLADIFWRSADPLHQWTALLAPLVSSVLMVYVAACSRFASRFKRDM